MQRNVMVPLMLGVALLGTGGALVALGPDDAPPPVAIPPGESNSSVPNEGFGVVGRWYDDRGRPLPDGVRPDTSLVLHVIRGAEHCEWESVEILSMAWPPGTRFPGSGLFRQYVRDTEAALAPYFGQDRLARRFDGDALLPGDARPTRMHRGEWELWISPSKEGGFVYLVAPGRVERWPRAHQVVACR